MRTFLAQQRRVSARRQSTAPWSKLDISCSSTQNCRWTKCLHVFAAAWIFNFATSQFHKAFIPPKRMEVPKLWHLHSLLCFEILFSFLLSCAVCFQQAHVFTVSTYSNFVGHTQRAWTFASFLVPVKNSHWGSVEEKSPRAFDFGIRGKSQIP